MKNAVYWFITYVCGTAGVISLALLAPLADTFTGLPGLDIPYAASFFMALFFLVPLATIFSSWPCFSAAGPAANYRKLARINRY